MITVCYGFTSFLTISLGMMIIINAFSEKRYAPHTAYILFYIIMILQIIWEAWDSTRAFVTDLQMLLYPIINLIILKMFFRFPFFTSLLCLWSYNLMIAFVRIPLLTARGVYEEKGAVYANVLGGRTYMECIWNLFIISVVLFLIIKGKSQILLFLKRVENNLKKKMCIFVVDIIAFFLMEWMAGFGREGAYTPKNMFVNLLILLILIFLLVVYIFRSIHQYNKLVIETLQIQKRLMVKEYQFIREYCEKEAKRFHDVKHTFLYLQKCIEENALEDAKTCLNSHLENTKNREWKIWTGFMDIDCILNYVYERMIEHGVEFVQDIEIYTQPVQGEDIIVILGNLLDNALEAVVKCPSGMRRIELDMKQMNDFFTIKVKNASRNIPVMNEKKFLSGKTDKMKHGWGLENVKQIVEENNGELQCTCENGMFIVNIIFYGGFK